MNTQTRVQMWQEQFQVLACAMNSELLKLKQELILTDVGFGGTHGFIWREDKLFMESALAAGAPIPFLSGRRW